MFPFRAIFCFWLRRPLATSSAVALLRGNCPILVSAFICFFFFARVSLRGIWCVIGFRWLTSCFVKFFLLVYWVLPSFECDRYGFAVFRAIFGFFFPTRVEEKYVSLDLTEYYWVLPSFTGFSWRKLAKGATLRIDLLGRSSFFFLVHEPPPVVDFKASAFIFFTEFSFLPIFRAFLFIGWAIGFTAFLVSSCCT